MDEETRDSVTPPPEFDVNSFLKKTLYNFKVNEEDPSLLPSTSTPHPQIVDNDSPPTSKDHSNSSKSRRQKGSKSPSKSPRNSSENGEKRHRRGDSKEKEKRRTKNSHHRSGDKTKSQRTTQIDSPPPEEQKLLSKPEHHQHSRQEPKQMAPMATSSTDHDQSCDNRRSDYYDRRPERHEDRHLDRALTVQVQTDLHQNLDPEFGRLNYSPSKNSLVSASSSMRLVCRICQVQGDPGDQLISPCRCCGTMKYVHTACLVHWLEISTKKMHPSPTCELCGYQYQTHRCFRLSKLQFPRCSHRDKLMHLVFIIVLMVMVGCAGLSVLYLQADQGYRVGTTLSGGDTIVIICSVLFFASFFIALFTQYKAEASLCRLLFRGWLINRHWRIKNYDRRDDVELQQDPLLQIQPVEFNNG